MTGRGQQGKSSAHDVLFGRHQPQPPVPDLSEDWRQPISDGQSSIYLNSLTCWQDDLNEFINLVSDVELIDYLDDNSELQVDLLTTLPTQQVQQVIEASLCSWNDLLLWKHWSGDQLGMGIYQEGALFHCSSKPALTVSDGQNSLQLYCQFGQPHRLGGPALIITKQGQVVEEQHFVIECLKPGFEVDEEPNDYDEEIAPFRSEPVDS